MKIVHPYVDLIQQEPGFDGIMKHIERCGRTCYKSEDKITDDSADTFVANLIKNKHYAMLEHGTVYLKIDCNESLDTSFNTNPYSIVKFVGNYLYITTNYRVLLENEWLDTLCFICEPTRYHVPRITLKFTTNIGVTREGNRMRANSIAEESTRYCNYSKDKYDKQLSICKPVWIDDQALEIYNELSVKGEFDYINASDDMKAIAVWYRHMYDCQCAYNNLISLGWTPQQAREVLPLGTKSEVVYTAFPHQWKHFFDLRLFGTTGKPHPNMQEIAELAQGVLEENNLWELIYPSNDKK